MKMIRNPLKTILVSGCLSLTLSTTALAHEHSPLEQVIAQRSDEQKQRDQFRHPADTLEFFQIKPGMVVAEALPFGGWYSRILARYLGEKGTLYGINYVDSMWARFGFFSEEAIANNIKRTKTFAKDVSSYTDNGIKADGYTFETVPKSLEGTVDRVLFVRALHNLYRFEDEAGTLTQALKATHKMLKRGGMVGVVQHEVEESASKAASDGGTGYMKASDVKAAFKAAGFELVASSDINKNPKDKPAEGELVWRLPPSYFQTGEDENKKKAVDAIGESNRMTLLFKKI